MIDYPYQYLPPLDSSTLTGLRESILEIGVQHAIEKDEDGNILDGHHRLMICEQEGITDYPVKIIVGLTEEEKIRYTVSINENRRRPDENNRKFAALKMRESNRWSLRQIADMTGVSHMAVQKWISGVNLVYTCPDDEPGLTLGRDGKSYPSKRPTTITAKNDTEATAVADALHSHGLPNEQTSFTASEILLDARATDGHIGALSREHKQEAESKQSPMFSSDTYEWYTPPHIIYRARIVLGVIELDPCTSEQANQLVQAQEFYTASDDGLSRNWDGAVWLNPPYGDTIGKWVEKLRSEYRHGRTKKALALVPARTDTAWFNALREFPRCFLRGRLKFTGPDADTEGNSAPFPSCVVALGCNVSEFADAFRDLGDVYVLAPQKQAEVK